MRNYRQPRTIAAIGAGLVVALIIVFAVHNGSVTQRGSTAQADCPAHITTGAAGSTQYTAYDVDPHGLACSAAVNLVNAFLNEEVTGAAAARCTASARQKPGCLVNGYRCRAVNLGSPPQVCASGQREVRFNQVKVN